MALETSTYIDGLVATNPTSGDPKSAGDDHIRLVKSTVKATFPNLTGAMTASQAELNILDGATVTTAELNILDGVTATAAELNVLDGITATTTELNYVAGVTSAIQAQLNAEAIARAAADTSLNTLKAPLSSPALTDIPTAPTATVGTNTTQIATTEFVQQASLAVSLPNQAGNSGNFLTTDGANASWSAAPNQIPRIAKSGAYTAVLADRGYLIDCTATMTLSLTAAATLGSGWYAYVRNNGTGTITIDPNGLEQIDAANTVSLYPGEVRIVQCDGTEFRTIKLHDGSGGVLIVQDQKASGTSGGNSTSTTVHVRDLQTTTLNTLEGASVASNAVTLSKAGTYEFMAMVPAGGSNAQRAYIYNDTDATYDLASSNNSTTSGTSTMVVMGIITITASKTFSVRHYTTTGAASGLGSAVTDGRPEIYTVLRIRRLA